MTFFIFTPAFSQNNELGYEVEKIATCGYIFEFLPDGNIICAKRFNELGTLGADVNVLDLKNNKLIKVATINDVYISEKGEIGYERGLIGLTLDPKFKDNNYIYLHYTYKEDNSIYKKVVRYKMINYALKYDKMLIDKIPANYTHNGGPLEFGPDDKLYITNGDADKISPERRLALNQPWKRSFDTLHGKILRIDRDGNIPEDNPFPNSPIYTYGHRNVFGIAFHPITGLPYISENGPDTDDELNILYKGKDYGWPIILGYDNPLVNESNFNEWNFNPDNYIRPIWSNGHRATAPTQLTFYMGNKYKEFFNNLFFLTFHDGILNRVVFDDTYTKIKEFHTYQLYIPWPTDIEVYNGDIYVSNLDDEIYIVKFYNHESSNVKNNLLLNLKKYTSMIDINNTIKLIAKLSNNNGTSLADMPINFRINDTIIGTVKTANNGYAKIIYKFKDPGLYIIKAEFNTNDLYQNNRNEYLLFVMNNTMYNRNIVYETVSLDNNGNIDPNNKVRLTLMPVDKERVSNINSTILIVELIDKNNEIIDTNYTLSIINNDKILFTQTGNANSNIHAYTFSLDSNILINYEDKEASITVKTLPEFINNIIGVYTSIILILVSLFILYKNYRYIHVSNYI
jgi:glucose/arabinose dehydrogenase